jgi:hypothetical protein
MRVPLAYPSEQNFCQSENEPQALFGVNQKTDENNAFEGKGS